jgi:3',5'-cyclic AMP phosphodiesterase CpdA
MTFTLAHLSDVHLAPLPAPRRRELLNKRITGFLNWQRRRRFIHDRATLDALVADLKSRHTDHIAVTGDLANIALPGEYSLARAWLETLGTPTDVTVVPGNHDAYVPIGLQLAEQEWGAFMRGDAGESFPFVRRRGPLALIGISSAVPTAPFRATGRIGYPQLAALPSLLDQLKEEELFRLVLVHHPPVSQAGRSKRLIDAAALKDVLASHGAELLLHGHDHLHMLNWLAGPDGSCIPAVGVHSASAAAITHPDSAAYHLFEIEGTAGNWQCTLTSRGLAGDGSVQKRLCKTLIGSK